MGVINTAINASFLLSGMLQLQVMLPTDHTGRNTTMRISFGNGRSSNRKGESGIQTMEIQQPTLPHERKLSFRNESMPENLFSTLPSNRRGESGHFNSNASTTPMETATRSGGRSLPFSSVMRREENCGEVSCDPDSELCLTWSKKEKVESKQLKECVDKAGILNHVSTDVSRSGKEKLCQTGMTHSIKLQESVMCSDPQCRPVLKYDCVQEKDSPHSCDIRKCRKGFLCVEVTHCERHPPCVVLAECHHISIIEPQLH